MTCPISAMSVVLLWIFEANVACSTDAHESEQRVAEVRHGEISIYTHQKDTSQSERPNDHLKSMYGRSVQVRREVFEKAFAAEGCDRVVIGADDIPAVLDLALQGLQILVCPVGGRRRIFVGLGCDQQGRIAE